MTHRPSTPQHSRSSPHSSHESLSSLKRPHTQQPSHIKAADMVQSKAILHIIEILGVFVCAHHFWPKGVTYGEAEDWEIEHRKRHAHGSHSQSKSKKSGSQSHTGSSSDGVRRSKSKREDRARDYDYDYDERPRHSRHASSRY
jgi:hypothetical protein